MLVAITCGLCEGFDPQTPNWTRTHNANREPYGSPLPAPWTYALHGVSIRYAVSGAVLKEPVTPLWGARIALNLRWSSEDHQSSGRTRGDTQNFSFAVRLLRGPNNRGVRRSSIVMEHMVEDSGQRPLAARSLGQARGILQWVSRDSNPQSVQR